MRPAAWTVLALLLLGAAPVLAQQTPPTPPRTRPDSVRADTTTGTTIIRTQRVDTAAADSVRLRVQPRTAFIRSLLVPGWGQISAGAYKSAAVFIGLQAASDFMLVKTIGTFNKARNAEKDSTAALFGRLTTKGDSASLALLDRYKSNPDLLNATLDSAGSVHSLVVSRKRQREDWITLAAFWTLASAADAFVVAQLSDFPADVQIEPRDGGGMFLRIGIRTRRPW